MKPLKIVSALLFLVIVQPIWFYLLHTCLKGVGASELQMFLFWIYVPLKFFILLVLKLAEKVE